MATDKMTQAEIDAILAYKAEKEAEEAAARDAERSLDDRFVGYFEDFCEGTATPPHIMEALATIAFFFHDDDPEFRADAYVDNLGNEVRGSEPNNCGFNQKGVMGNLCQQAMWMKEREQKRFYYLRDQAMRARRAFDQTEIAREELQAKELEYGRCKVVNLPILEDFVEATKAAYRAAFAEEWTPPVRRDTRASTAQLEDRFAHQPTRKRL